MNEAVKIVVFVPKSYANVVCKAMGKAGAGKIGNYTFCSFSSKGVGRFLPGEGAHPAIGKLNFLESIAEERIKVMCDKELLESVVAAIKHVHPYEEVALDIYPLITVNA